MRLIIVGCGGMGVYHAKKFHLLGSSLVGAIDHNEEHRNTLCSTYNIPWRAASLDQLDEMQNQADAVVCALPDRFHKECCLKALSLGFSLFCEKPMGYNLMHANEITEALRSNNVPAMVNYSKRNMSALYALKDLLDTGELGSLVSVNIAYDQNWVRLHTWGDWRSTERWKWRLLPEMSNNGCIGDLASHLVDTLFFLFSKVEFSQTLRCYTLKQAVVDGVVDLDENAKRKFFPERSVPVEYAARLEVGNGISCFLSCTQISPAWEDCFQINIVGTLETATLNSSLDRKQIHLTSCDGEESWILGPVVASTYERFTNWVDNGTPSHPTLEEGLLVQKILEEMQCP